MRPFSVIMYDTTKVVDADDMMQKLLREKKVAREFQERKHTDWNENYELYRNKVKTNRLTQRQAVNIPLMKETVKTILSTIDEPPQVDWKEKSGDEFKELVYQEMWNEMVRHEKLDWVDVLDKKNVLLYGLSTKMLNTSDEGIEIDALDTYDIVYDPLMNPLDIESARFIVRQNIFRPIRDILADERYLQAGRDKLKMWVTSSDGIVYQGQNKEEYEKKIERLKSMGVNSDEFAHFAAGDTIVNLCEHYSKVWNTKTEKFEKRVYVYGDDWCLLLDEKIEDLIGMDDYPFVVWFEDPETNDIYPDSIADLVRTPNKLLNVWFSQQVENRTLQNFQMHWYDATIEGYTPQTYEPGPGRMLPAPGDPNKTILPVQINGLDETMTAIDFLTKIVERGSGAVAIQKGQSEQSAQTLGEVQILVGKAQERSVAMQKFYRGSWYELAKKWDKMMHANPPKKTKLYRTGRGGKLYEKVITPSDWKSTAGYEPTVQSSSENEQNTVKTVQKFQFILQQFPNNQVLRKIAQRREMELLDLTPDELKQIEEEEDRMMEQAQQEAAQAQMQQQGPAQPQPQQAPQMPQEDMGAELDQLSQLMQ